MKSRFAKFSKIALSLPTGMREKQTKGFSPFHVLFNFFPFKPILLYLGCGEINWPFGLREIDWAKNHNK